MSFNQFSSGLIQLPSSNNQNQLMSTTSSVSSTSGTSGTSGTSAQTIVSDINISPVGNSIDPTLYVYDGLTTLYINSTVNLTSNAVQLQYFDPVTGYPNMGMSSGPNFGFQNWNFDMVSQNYLNGCATSSNLLGESTYLYDNLQQPSSSPNYLGTHSIDITNGNSILDSSGNASNTMFFSLTSQPYLSYKGVMYSSPGLVGAPQQANIQPNYTTLGTDAFLFTSQYWVPTNNEILIVQLIFNIVNTGSTYFSSSNPSSAIPVTPAPIITVTVYNKVISREMLASIGTGQSCPKPKIYSTGVISLQYLQSGQQFNSSIPSQFLFNNVPVVIADGYRNSFASFGVYYIPPCNINLHGNNCQFLAARTTGGDTTNGNGFTIQNFIPTGDITNIQEYTGTFPSTTGIGYLSSTQTSYGHFVISISYSYNPSKYLPGTSFFADVLVKNIWRSPVAIYSSYSAFSVNDLVNKQVVLLFGKTSNGGTFLVTNTGTHLAQITNYGVTSLGNFMLIMKIVFSSFNSAYTLSDYFINTTLINIINSTFGVNILPVLLQPILEGSMVNPPSVRNCPNMWYMFLNAKNGANLSIDPTYQTVFNGNISSYMGLPSSNLCDAGLCKYFNSELSMLGTNITNNITSNTSYFGNSLYLGLNVINANSYYMLIIFPEALFNGLPLNTSNNIMSIYATYNTIFYFMINNSSSAAFIPDANTVSSSSSSAYSTSSNAVNNSYSLSKINLPVSNVQLL
jgi:hypothetical protein